MVGMTRARLVLVLLLLAPAVLRGSDGNGGVTLSRELRQWHAVALDLAGPFASESDTAPNPFTDFRFSVTFEHESGTPTYTVPGSFAADGHAAESGAEAGNVWRAYLSPDRVGRWSYRVSFVRGPGIATADSPGESVPPFDGKTGTFDVVPTDKQGRDLRAKGSGFTGAQRVAGHTGASLLTGGSWGVEESVCLVRLV